MGLNVLIVDDSVAMRRMISQALSMTDLEIDEIHQAGNGQEGLDVLNGDVGIDLALVDIHMPVMRGPEMIRIVRDTPALANLPVVIVSSESSENRIREMAEMGVTLVPKPFTPEEFNEALSTVLADVQGAAVDPPPVEVEDLRRISRQVLETMAFAFVNEDESQEDPETSGLAIRSTMPFAGPLDGEFRMAMPIETLSELADNMLGMDGEPVGRQQMLDALGELTNVLGGNLLAELAGDHSSFELQHPEVSEDAAHEPLDGEIVTSILHVDDGWVRIDMVILKNAPATA